MQNKGNKKRASQSQATSDFFDSLMGSGGPTGGAREEFGTNPTADVHDPHLSPGDGCTVLLFDPVHDRRNQIRGIIAEASGQPRIIETVNASTPEEPPGRNAIALVAAGSAAEQNQPVLDLILRLKRAGLNIFAYEDGMRRWPVRSKCLPLVAGATHLLDSGSPGFAAELHRLLRRMLEELAVQHRQGWEMQGLMRCHGIIGDSPAITGVFRLALRFSVLSDLPVLITGDTGTGKELLARAIAKMDPKRKAGPFVTINCAAVNPALIESEFFGHRRGAFTGAERDRKGLIRAAEGGVLFLDEIGELDSALQAKLLRVLQENCVLSVGEEQEAAVNVRFIAATNRNLEQLVAERSFRVDLFHRLRVLLIHMPPLRERPADLPALIEHFLRKHHQLHGTSAAGVSQDFLEAMQQLDLSGNVRQLENLVRQALVNHQHEGELDLNDLPADVLRRLSARPQQSSLTQPHASSEPQAVPGDFPAKMKELVKRILQQQGWNLSRALQECEREVFQSAMLHTQGNQSQAARLLGITTRSVYNKVRKHRLNS